MCFPEYDTNMDGLGVVSNVLGDNAVTTGDTFCICITKYMPGPAQPKGGLHLFFSIVGLLDIGYLLACHCTTGPSPNILDFVAAIAPTLRSASVIRKPDPILILSLK
jgi:hypothetical protein